MRTVYGEIPNQSIAALKRYYYGALIDVLHKHDEDYPYLNNRIQTLINQISGSLNLFNDDARVLSIVAWLENARENPSQFRKNILDAANMIDELGGESNV